MTYASLTGPDSVLRLVPVTGANLERHIHLILPPSAETSPAVLAFVDLMTRIRAEETA